MSTILMYSCDNEKIVYNEKDQFVGESEYKYIKNYFGPKSKVFRRNDSKILYWSVIDSNNELFFVITGGNNSPEITNIEKQIEIR